MALVWIKKITNSSKHAVTFQQNDPSYHPVIHSGINIQLPDTPGAPSGSFRNKDIQIGKDQRIVVKSGGALTADYFVIPWEGYGRLKTSCSACGFKSVKAYVGGGGLTQDSIKFNQPNFPAMPCGDKGPMLHVELEITVSDKGVKFDITNKNSIPELKRLQDELIRISIEIAREFADKFFNGK